MTKSSHNTVEVPYFFIITPRNTPHLGLYGATYRPLLGLHRGKYWYPLPSFNQFINIETYTALTKNYLRLANFTEKGLGGLRIMQVYRDGQRAISALNFISLAKNVCAE